MIHTMLTNSQAFFTGLFLALGSIVVGSFTLTVVLRRRGYAWGWSAPMTGLSLVMWPLNPIVAIVWGLICTIATANGWRWNKEDLEAGGDLAEEARNRKGFLDIARATAAGRAINAGLFFDKYGLVVGRDPRRRLVHVPVGYESGKHTLVVGATGAGKTVTQAWITRRLILEGHGAIVIDPKGDRLLKEVLYATHKQTGRALHVWSPEGSASYNPYGHGTDSEIADKLLAAEEYTEPHYLRLAQRYLGHVVRTLRAADRSIELRTIVELMHPDKLELAARDLYPEHAEEVVAYLDSLGPKQREDLKGTRDRLATVAESDVGHLLGVSDEDLPYIDLVGAMDRSEIVYFELDVDRRPLLGQMLAAAIVQDLVTLAAEHQRNPMPTVIVLDEFSAVGAEHVVRLFGRGRSAGFSMVLGTQELADLDAAGPAIRGQVTGNIDTLIAHRQTVPASAEHIASMAGTRGTWITTTRTDGIGVSEDAGTRTRGREFVLHPDNIKRLGRGQAAVVNLATGSARVARILHPKEHL